MGRMRMKYNVVGNLEGKITERPRHSRRIIQVSTMKGSDLILHVSTIKSLILSYRVYTMKVSDFEDVSKIGNSFRLKWPPAYYRSSNSCLNILATSLATIGRTIAAQVEVYCFLN
jgi:hypothetical protein